MVDIHEILGTSHDPKAEQDIVIFQLSMMGKNQRITYLKTRPQLKKEWETFYQHAFNKLPPESSNKN